MIIQNFLKTFFSLLLLIPSGNLFTQENYIEALENFDNAMYSRAYEKLIDITRDGTENSANALFWAARSAIELENWEKASLHIDYFIANYPDSIYFAEAHYLRGRILFKTERYEDAVNALIDFSSDFVNTPFAANAYFWIGESLFRLGNVRESKLYFKKIIDEYPESYKIEAARYKLSVIELAVREEKLMELLRWSHEEFLKTSQESIKRRKEYEEALSVYQKRILELKEKEQKYSNRSRILGMMQEALELKDYYLDKSREFN